MQYKGTNFEYGLVAQAIHWISAILIFILIPIGVLMTHIQSGPLQDLLLKIHIQSGSLQVLLFKIHILIGLTVLLLTLFRVLWVFFDKRPIENEHMTQLNYYLFKAVQIGMYLVVVLLTFSGLILFLSSGLVDVLFGTKNLIPLGLHHTTFAEVHDTLAKIFIALIGFHILGVIYHQYAKSDILSKMGIKIKYLTRNYPE